MRKRTEDKTEDRGLGRLRSWWRRRSGAEDPNRRAGSRAGLWDAFYGSVQTRQMYSDDQTARRGAGFLDVPEVETVEDWGCGLGGFKSFLRDDQKYIGIDGSRTPYAAKVTDLIEYRSEVDAIFMRGVLEHNPRWEEILTNALGSFRYRMVLVLFTPFARRTKVIRDYPDWWGSGVTMVDIAFASSDLTRHFAGLEWSVEANVKTNSQYKREHVFYLKRSSHVQSIPSR